MLKGRKGRREGEIEKKKGKCACVSKIEKNMAEQGFKKKQSIGKAIH